MFHFFSVSNPCWGTLSHVWSYFSGGWLHVVESFILITYHVHTIAMIPWACPTSVGPAHVFESVASLLVGEGGIWSTSAAFAFTFLLLPAPKGILRSSKAFWTQNTVTSGFQSTILAVLMIISLQKAFWGLGRLCARNTTLLNHSDSSFSYIRFAYEKLILCASKKYLSWMIFSLRLWLACSSKPYT